MACQIVAYFSLSIPTHAAAEQNNSKQEKRESKVMTGSHMARRVSRPTALKVAWGGPVPRRTIKEGCKRNMTLSSSCKIYFDEQCFHFLHFCSHRSERDTWRTSYRTQSERKTSTAATRLTGGQVT